jgi:hypothetical protein
MNAASSPRPAGRIKPIDRPIVSVALQPGIVSAPAFQVMIVGSKDLAMMRALIRRCLVRPYAIQRTPEIESQAAHGRHFLTRRESKLTGFGIIPRGHGSLTTVSMTGTNTTVLHTPAPAEWIGWSMETGV